MPLYKLPNTTLPSSIQSIRLTSRPGQCPFNTSLPKKQHNSHEQHIQFVALCLQTIANSEGDHHRRELAFGDEGLTEVLKEPSYESPLIFLVALAVPMWVLCT